MKEMMKYHYEQYSSLAPIQIYSKEYYQDKDGYPNAKAFEDFSEKIEGEYFLICINVDVRKANATSYEYGNYIMRKFILALNSISNCYTFRMHGEKFNIFIHKESLPALNELFEKESEDYDVYVGDSGEAYDKTLKNEQIRKNVELMFEDKHTKRHRQKAQQNSLLGSKLNTPLDLRETTFKKHRSTMWYSIIRITILEPIFKEVKVYVFPTKFCKPLHSIPLLVVIDDLLGYRVLHGNDIKFGLEGILFSINARFGRDGHLNTAAFHSGEGKCEIAIATNEGVCIPANFGKRIGNAEIYPIKPNIHGTFDFVLLNDETPELNTTGIITHDEKQYMVMMDSEYIDLVPVDGKEQQE